MSFDIMISVSVTFLKGVRKLPPCLTTGNYSPHLKIDTDDEYLGVTFKSDVDCRFDEAISVNVIPMYEGVDYSKLEVGKKFFVMEGDKIVGSGIVESIVKLD